jgi:hypothetical protein
MQSKKEPAGANALSYSSGANDAKEKKLMSRQ